MASWQHRVADRGCMGASISSNSRMTLDFSMEDYSISTESVGSLQSLSEGIKLVAMKSAKYRSLGFFASGQLSVVLFGRICDALATTW